MNILNKRWEESGVRVSYLGHGCAFSLCLVAPDACSQRESYVQHPVGQFLGCVTGARQRVLKLPAPWHHFGKPSAFLLTPHACFQRFLKLPVHVPAGLQREMGCVFLVYMSPPSPISAALSSVPTHKSMPSVYPLSGFQNDVHSTHWLSLRIVWSRDFFSAILKGYD